MARMPFIGRLFLREYLALIGSLLLVGLEGFIRIVTLALPQPIVRGFYRVSRVLFNRLSKPQEKRARGRREVSSRDIRDASDFVDLCTLHGYYAEEHIVQTTDGYLLGLHRLGWRKGEERMKVNNGKNSLRKRVIYMHHGLLMNSEVWVCMTDKKRCLAFQLVDKGYDVWFGNNRGNKYSKKATNRSPSSNEFWNFSMDEFAFHDIPNSISYILNTTAQPSLSYIGFSQGTAQALAALSVHPKLNDQVDVFIGLAPAMSPAGLSNGIVDSLVKASPEVIFLAFGRRIILGSTPMWQSLLYPPIFVRIIDTALSFLFNWSGCNITQDQKLAAYPHLYSFTSTKSVVHWFQIIRTGTFQMYDDDVQAPSLLSVSGSNKYYKVAKFPTRNIKTPIVLVYGGSDSLVDIDVMLHELPKHTIASKIPQYEHLDFLWADSTHNLVFPHVYDALTSYADPSDTKAAYAHPTSTVALLSSPVTPQPPTYSEDERLALVSSSSATASPAMANTTTADVDSSSEDQQPVGGGATPTPSQGRAPPAEASWLSKAKSTSSSSKRGTTALSSAEKERRGSRVRASSSSSPSGAQATGLGLSPSSDGSASSSSSKSIVGVGADGITLGMSRAAGGVVTREVGAARGAGGGGLEGGKKVKVNGSTR
ncbi:MAG: hypothetical protein M1825_001312 [Sarcosagium campestre]|nr:MAG: hypothetical protein M1825_001312 [Sarcosagium campestre]